MPFLDVFHLKHYKGDSKKLAFSAPLPDLNTKDGILAFAGPAHFELTLTNVGLGAIHVEGKIYAALNVFCSRCLKEFVFSAEALLNEMYYDQNQVAPQGRTEEWTAYTGDEIDLTPEVLSAVLISLPIRVICAHTCKGLCPICGTDLNMGQCACTQEEIDPRMAKLKELLDQ